jgi:hypothetical protein
MEDVEDVFDDLGAESNGHGWESLAWWMTRSEMPDLGEPIWFRSESGTFVAGSSDTAALRRLAERLHAAFHDRSLLARLIVQSEITDARTMTSHRHLQRPIQPAVPASTQRRWGQTSAETG